jgi:hypothetical protein
MTPAPAGTILIGANQIRSDAMTFSRPGLACVRCGEPFSLFLARPDARKVEELPDPFQAICPFCKEEATYPKSSIQILVAVGPR